MKATEKMAFPVGTVVKVIEDYNNAVAYLHRISQIQWREKGDFVLYGDIAVVLKINYRRNRGCHGDLYFLKQQRVLTDVSFFDRLLEKLS